MPIAPGLIQGYARGVLEKWTEIASRPEANPRSRSRRERCPRGSGSTRRPISRNFLVPGLITLIMTLIGILLTALGGGSGMGTRNHGSHSGHTDSQNRSFVGQSASLFYPGYAGYGFVRNRRYHAVSCAVSRFHQCSPFLKRSFYDGLLWALGCLYPLRFESSLSLPRFLSSQDFCPLFFCPGLVFDLDSTPRFIQILSHLVPARYFVSISHTLFMAGNIWPVLLPHALALADNGYFIYRSCFSQNHQTTGELMHTVRRILGFDV